MRLPKGMNQGTFSLDCPGCRKELEIEVRGRDKKSLLINGRPYSPPKLQPLKKPIRKVPSRVVVATELEMEMDLPYHKRMRVIFFILVVVGILGIFSSFSTIIGSFSINDVEEKSPHSLVTLSVWIIDADTGRAIEGVEVTLVGGPSNYTGFSNQEGLALIEDIVSGEMDLVVSKEGYMTVKSEITIKKGSPNVIDIPMEKGDTTDVRPILVHQFGTKTYSGFITNVAATLMLLASFMAFTAAVFVYRKEFFLLVLFSAFLSVFSFGFLIGSVLATLALVMIILSYDGFSHTHTLLDMLEKVRSQDIRGMLRPDDRKMSGLPPLRKR